jgi:hypothetical protein
MSKEKDAVIKDGLLTAEELQALEAEVQRELDKEQKTKARDALKKEMMAKARVARGLREASEWVRVELPEDSSRIIINMVPFVHGGVYEVPGSVAMQLRETMGRAWENQAVVEGRRKDFYTKRNTRMSGLTGATTNAPFLRG